MDSARLQGILGRGYAIAARQIGQTYDVYRPSGAVDPISDPNKLDPMTAAFTPHSGGGFQFDKPSDYSNPLFHGLFDTRITQVGDYFVNSAVGTYFIASMDPTFPTLCVQCSRTVSISRPHGATEVGLNSYGGNVVATEVPVMTNWPASLLETGKGRQKQTGDLPGDVGSGGWTLLLPLVPGILLRDSDIMVDDLDRRYVLGTCELQSYGWRCKAMQMVT